MIKSFEEYQKTREYSERLQVILLALRHTHTPGEYTHMSKGFLTELAKAQREITLYLAIPESAEHRKDAA